MTTPFLSDKQRLAIRELAARGLTGVGDLGAAIGVGKGMGSMLGSLRQRGLVRCTRDDRKRGANRWSYALTAAGEAVAKDLATT